MHEKRSSARGEGSSAPTVQIRHNGLDLTVTVNTSNHPIRIIDESASSLREFYNHSRRGEIALIITDSRAKADEIAGLIYDADFRTKVRAAAIAAFRDNQGGDQ